jgi:hypothetical protein
MSGFTFSHRCYILLCGCACLFSSCSRGDLSQQLTAYAEDITQIEFSQGADTVTLTEIDGQWVVNHGRPARAACLSDWWRVALNWQLRPLVADEALQRKIANSVVEEGIQVAVFTRRLDRPLFTFYIAKTAHVGTVVYSNEQLFLASIPYWDYEVADVFSAKPAFWKDATIFACAPPDLDTVVVEHLQRPGASFKLVRDGSEWQPVSVPENHPVNPKNKALIDRYVTYFQQVEADTVTGNLSDSALAAIRRHLQHRITVKTAKGSLTVELFGIPLGEKAGYDTDKCLLFMVETKEWAQASWVSFDLLLKDLNDFVEKNKE